MENIIELDNVTKRFGGITALNKASLKVTRGEVVGLIGDNGAGKSTLIKTLVGVYSPDEGDILIDGRNITYEDVRKIGYMPEERGLYKKMKVGDFLLFMGKLKGLNRF